MGDLAFTNYFIKRGITFFVFFCSSNKITRYYLLKTYQQPVENFVITIETNIETLFGYYKPITNRRSN